MQFIVLRDRQRTRTGAFGRGFGPSATAVAPPEPEIAVEDLDRADRDVLMRDPAVVAVTRPMPIRLVAPIEAGDDAAAAAEPSWGIAAVGADRTQFTGAGTIVAVLDTGIDAGHPAFAGMTIVEQDFSGTGNGDRLGHGTHCAGTVFGRDVNGVRIGVARGVTRALVAKILDDTGAGSSEMALRGIQWAVEQGAHVMSMSVGFDYPGVVQQLVDQGWPVDISTSVALEAYRGNLRMFEALMAMIRAREAFSSGSVLVAAAGNESRRDENPDYEVAVSLPAAAEGVVSVGAIDRSPAGWQIAPFSNTFPLISAPGTAIPSAQAGGDGTRLLSGTSMACPHVAGVAALWWEFVRTQVLPPFASTVVARTLGTARIDGFAPDTDVADRGVGIVSAP